MEGLNLVVLIGNLGRDPELGYTHSGTAFLKFPVATSTSRLDKFTGTRKRVSDWHQVILWGPAAESLHKFLRKGHLVHINGTIKNSTYECDGEKRHRSEVVAHKVNCLNSSEERPSWRGK